MKRQALFLVLIGFFCFTSQYVFCQIKEGGTRLLTDTEYYVATLRIQKDGAAWNDHGKTFTLKLSTDETVTSVMVGAGNVGTSTTLTAYVPNGTWKIFDSENDTENTIVINNGAGTGSAG